jgi:hypothetical protein
MTPHVSQDRRQEARTPVNIAARLHCHRLSREAVIVDYSLAGLRIDSRLAVVIGERVTVKLPSGHGLLAQVMWVAGPHIGVRFFERLKSGHPDMLALWEAIGRHDSLDAQDGVGESTLTAPG